MKRCSKAKVCRLCAGEGHGKEECSKREAGTTAMIAEEVTVREARSIRNKLERQTY